MCDKPTKPLDWDKKLEAFDPDSPGRLPRPANVLCDNYRLKSGQTCKLVLVENEHESSTFLYHHSGLPVLPYSPVLRNKTKKVTKWYNLWADRPGMRYYDTEVEAVCFATNSLATLSIEIEEPL